MIELTRTIWGLLRAETREGRRLRRVWAMPAAALVVLLYAALYCAAVPFCAVIDWLDRRERCPRWLRGFGGSTRDRLESIFFAARETDGIPRDDDVHGRDGAAKPGAELYRIDGCVEPCRIGGPHPDYPALLAAARWADAGSGREDLLLAAWIDGGGRIALSSFSANELESDARKIG